ncbi:MAG TPA: dienelactone hydrolase family protein [Phycisphaerales bacterium]|nr:dienelactone hydrolase family protein [Phycisphaerales bacterium]
MTGPHFASKVTTFAGGRSIEEAGRAVVYLHGRGGSARDILSLAVQMSPADAVSVAPTAAGHTWYPFSFLAPIEQNQPGIDSAHGLIERILADLGSAGIPSSSTALVGFSQGACLATDHALRFPRRYGAVVGLTGGLIGPPGFVFEPSGSLHGTPVLLASGDRDPHVPWERVVETECVLRRMGAEVTLLRYPDAPHAVLPEQVVKARELLERMEKAR